MNFTLEGRILKYVDENTILIYQNSGNCKKNPKWKETYICIDYYGYKFIRIYDKKIKIHRIIGYLFLGLDIYNKEQVIDHINGIRNDNRLENLRIVSQQQNMWNMKNIKGYVKHQNKFRAQIRLNKKCIELGSYKTEEEARQAYLDAKKIYHQIP
jgi:hypothetical protein